VLIGVSENQPVGIWAAWILTGLSLGAALVILGCVVLSAIRGRLRSE
jgi:hypothetical protein